MNISLDNSSSDLNTGEKNADSKHCKEFEMIENTIKSKSTDLNTDCSDVVNIEENIQPIESSEDTLKSKENVELSTKVKTDSFSTEIICLVEEDPIGIIQDAEKDEEICIIPDNERGKDAKTATTVEKTSQVNLDKEFITSVNKSQIKVIYIPEKESTDESCHQCCVVKKSLYKINYQPKKTLFLCSDICLISFRTLNKPSSEGLKLKVIAKKIPGSSNKIFVRKCTECKEKIKQGDEKVLSWETMDFCNEDCLSRYQNKIGSHCAKCKRPVWRSNLGKYCVRFGHDIRQFCCSFCLEEFKKGLKVCSYCQKDISEGTEGFLAPIGDKGQFKDFCSQQCMKKYNQMSNKNNNFSNISITPEISQCSVCKIEKQVQVLFVHQIANNETKNTFCSQPCFVAYKFVNKITALQCDMCKIYFETENCTEFSLFYDNTVKNFCSKTCQNIYIIANRRIVPCIWCKVKKYNFDMIKKCFNNGNALIICSLNCLNLFQVSVGADSSKMVKCDCCAKVSQAHCHLTMSNATLRNFCSNQCVISFQKKFSTKAIRDFSVSKVRMPVITNIQSLPNNSTPAKVNVNVKMIPTTPKSLKPQINQHFIVKSPPLPLIKNAATSCKPIHHSKGISCHPNSCTKQTQTDETKEKTVIVPIPVPIYIPAPLPMFSAPLPVPIPFPLPIPTPVFIPITRNSSAGIMNEMKKIQVKFPANPFEAELLQMAEMVAEEKKTNNTDSETSDDDLNPKLNEPVGDLEGALTANTIKVEQNEDNLKLLENLIRDCKRNKRQSKEKPNKKRKYTNSHVETLFQTSLKPVQISDANMYLKYTLGVNAWKQWIIKKNVELTKSSSHSLPIRFLKSEILDLSADELNYSLCLFIKEVKKPNGDVYMPDTIYYLCLGIQQYLYLNGRIDNIFTDPLYETFTNCLDQLANKFSIMYNDSHYIVTRVEEEHLWETKQLGVQSPHVLINTLIYFNTKYFNLTTADEHMQLSFSHILKHWKQSAKQNEGNEDSKDILLKFYPSKAMLASNPRKKKVYEQKQNEEDLLRCPVKLYEFYLLKSPECVKTRTDVFYLLPERSCMPDSPVWYSTMALGREALQKMLHRIRMVKEINVALLSIT